MTDLHCHILPGMDDGAADVDVSLKLLEKEYRDGVRQIAFTSHFNFERTTIEEYTRYREQAYQRLTEAVAQTDMKFDFKLGAEVFFSPGLVEIDAKPLCIGDTAYMLIEFPTTHRPHFIRETFRHLNNEGIIPLIAHVERYSYVMEDPRILYEWIAAGAYAQTNAGAILKGDKASKRILQFIQWDLVHVLSTDTHSPDKRPPRMAEAMAYVGKKLGEDVAERLKRNGDELFHDRELYDMEPYCPKKFLGMWR